jgi:hypothetical protein
MRRLSVGIFTIAAALATTHVASAGDKVAADAFFTQGMNALKSNDFAGACTAFKASEDADPSSGTEINLGVCNEKLGKLASAWHWYNEAARTAPTQNRPDRAEQAKKEADRLYPKTHRLIIVFADHADELAVNRDGDESKVPAGLNQLEVPIDPGTHTITVSAKGKKPQKKEVTANMAAASDKLEFAKLEDAPEEKPLPNVPPGGPGQDYKPPESGGSDGSKQRNIGFIVGGAGIVAGIVAVGLELLALREDDKRKEQDTALSTPPLKDAPATDTAKQNAISSRDSHKSAASGDQLGAIVVGAAGVVMIGIGVTLVLTAGSSKPTTGTHVVPFVTRDTAGVGLGGTF